MGSLPPQFGFGGDRKQRQSFISFPPLLSQERALRAHPEGTEGQVPSVTRIGPSGRHWAPFIFWHRQGWDHNFSGKDRVKRLGSASGPRGTRVFHCALKFPFAPGPSFPTESKRSIKARDKAQTQPGSQKTPISVEINGHFRVAQEVGVGHCPFSGWQSLATGSPNSPSTLEMPGCCGPKA